VPLNMIFLLSVGDSESKLQKKSAQEGPGEAGKNGQMEEQT